MSSEEPRTASSLDPRGGGSQACRARRSLDATKHGSPARSCAGVPAVFQWHTCVSREGLACEQMDPGGSRRSCPSEPIRLCRFVPGVHDIQQLLFLVDRRARPRHLEEAREPSYRASSDPFARTSSPWQSRLSSPRITVRNNSSVILHPLQFPGKLLRHPRNLVIIELILSPILFIAGNHFPPFFLHNQGYPKVCPDSLNLSNAGDSFAGTSSFSSFFLF
jgi:hypothetical protein